MTQLAIGQRFGRLTIVASAPARGYRRRWECRCDCGATKVADHSNIRSGATTSCGCLKREQTIAGGFATTHGMSNTPENGVWSGMIQRCTNPKTEGYERYGGRGITVCERWRASFVDFLADVGSRPSSTHSLDRFPDNDGNYEPGNVRWATRAQQAQRRRTSVLTVDLVQEIRGRFEHGESRSSIARRMKLRTGRVGLIVSNRAWPDTNNGTTA